MRLFGILLIIVNLLAGAGFVYLATENWQGRQVITAAGLKHVLVLQGLPYDGADGFATDDETPFVVTMAGGESTSTVSRKLLEGYFTAVTSAPATDSTSKVQLAGQTPVPSVVAELKRVRDLVFGELAKEALGPAEKIELYRFWLLPQAETIDVRNAYLALLSDRDANGAAKGDRAADLDALDKALKARFAAAIEKPQVTDGPPAPPADDKPAALDTMKKLGEWKAGLAVDEVDRQTRAAHLLVHLDGDAMWQKRVAAIVGLRKYGKVIAAQGLRFADMSRHVDRGIPGEQAAFVAHEAQLRDLATRNSDRARLLAAERLKLEEQKAAADDAVNRRRTQLAELVALYTKVKNEVDELLVRQSGIEAQLFEVQREVALTLDEVYRLEQLLIEKERERSGRLP
jgi:hypothetical protein